MAEQPRTLRSRPLEWSPASNRRPSPVLILPLPALEDIRVRTGGTNPQRLQRGIQEAQEHVQGHLNVLSPKGLLHYTHISIESILPCRRAKTVLTQSKFDSGYYSG